ncbi:hypothetical protein RDWZM_007693 [Blomia tropicalis]|uniref:Pseudouridine synthase n=1 Tax=Blomia tropicalis TaxID=40697 RepID=A0A9Q0RKP2_BLOTA|nr:RNA pseudouridylate synthase domain containing protein 2 [Blomia tropicalis]KAJ6216536.1 hypothetical protein RDWZM_007693 [Blomia tropicalis]
MSSNKRALENDDPINVTTSVCSNVNEDIIIENQNKKRVRLEDSSLNVSDYYIENGLRKVYPYIYTYNSYCKGRWVGSKLSELFEKEFRPVGEEVINMRCKNGLLKVNGGLVDANYTLKDNDFITNQIHRHEFPVLAAPIPIIHMDENFLVIDKPPSLPVHPCGKYRLNSITSLLEKENNITDLHVVHRLDRLTSGIMIFARNKTKAQKLHEQMRQREMHKEYVCRVSGEFPEGTIECEQPIETISHKIGICIVSSKGKSCKTTFKRINYNGVSSTVLCYPITGRMHQIRVHLQYLGHPIVNDSFYNSLAFGPNKGKGGEYGKSIEQLVLDIEEEHNRSRYVKLDCDSIKPTSDSNLENVKNDLAIKALHHYTSQPTWDEIQKRYEFDATKITQQDDCEDCRVKTCDPTPSEQFIYLHAYRYKGLDWSFETQLPIWAKETWNEN